MRIHSLVQKQFIPVSLDIAWDFFSAPANLDKITPPSMGFKIIEGNTGKMYPGQFIIYTVRPMLGIPVTWVTEITQVKEKEFFIDEQRMGPYKIWHHQHFFKEVPGGVEMLDIIHYAMPFGVFGNLALPIVKKKLGMIFSFRQDVINRKFPKTTTSENR
jgi:ligand-binding SRPBCC domain-containing protein